MLLGLYPNIKHDAAPVSHLYKGNYRIHYTSGRANYTWKPNMGVLQNGMATTKSLMHHTIVFFCGFGCRVKGHNNGVIDNFVVVG